MCVYLCRFTSGVKSILKLHLSKRIVTDCSAGERGVQSTQGPSQVLRGPALIKLFSLERDTREEILEKLRLRYETFFFL